MANEYGAALRRYRERVGMSRRELALACGFDPSYVSVLERGLRKPSLDTFETMAAALGVRVSTIVRFAERLGMSKP